MRFLAFASDYDGTLAWKGKIERQTLKALDALKQTGRKLILVTGRELPELLTIFPQAGIFDSVVAENGGLLYSPASGAMKLLTHPPSPEFVQRLRQKAVAPLSVGHSIVATTLKHKTTVLNTILEMELDLHVILNIDAVMVLPTGVNKGTGLTVALAELGIAAHNVVGAGDAENDDSFLSLCGFSVAVANAIPSLKRRAHKITKREHGAGVVELIQQIIASDS
jgi:hydroxymethylpyrimidine pyrophosphatase-like HAD family hydrolase